MLSSLVRRNLLFELFAGLSTKSCDQNKMMIKNKKKRNYQCANELLATTQFLFSSLITLMNSLSINSEILFK